MPNVKIVFPREHKWLWWSVALFMKDDRIIEGAARSKSGELAASVFASDVARSEHQTYYWLREQTESVLVSENPINVCEESQDRRFGLTNSAR